MVKEIFEDNESIEKIKTRLPELFLIAEMECSRSGRIGMQVGSLREQIIVAFLLYRFGRENVEYEIPITAPEEDVRVHGQPISIKTITGNSCSGIKLIWTVDWDKVHEFVENYEPRCHILLVRINWENSGGFFYIPLDVQQDVFEDFGKYNFIKLPKRGTNPRGVEYSKEALKKMIQDSRTKNIDIFWRRTIVDIDPYKRWEDLWKE